MDVVVKIGVLVDAAHSITPVTRPDHGEVHPGTGHLGPIDLLLVRGHIHPNVAGGVPRIGQKAVLDHKSAAVIVVAWNGARLRFRYMDEGQVVIHQDDRPLGPGSGAGGVKQVARLAGDETHGPGPLYRVDGPAGDGFPVREGGGHLGQRLPQGMPKDHSQLLPGHLVVGTEPSVIIAGD